MQVLLVEDEARLARSYQRNLEDEGHVVEVFYDGETAYARLVQESDRFDIVVMDILLPGMSGIKVCRAIRAEHIRVPILLLTALDQTEEKVAGLDAGADDYLTKPFPFEELLARMRALARRPYRFDPVAEATQLHCGDLVVDLMRHEVWRSDTLIPLTAREFVLLEFLVRHSGRVLTRQQLTDRVWPDGTEAGSNVLDTYIHYLREKIDRDFPTKLLHTIRGVGYMVRMPSGPTSSLARQTVPAGEPVPQGPEPPDESS
jgi:two-component system, OmpR family, copper resistance phosphate regulon response regulator CusR